VCVCVCVCGVHIIYSQRLLCNIKIKSLVHKKYDIYYI